MGSGSPNSIMTTQGFGSGNNDTMMAFSSANSISTTQGFSTGASTSTTLFGFGSPSPAPLFGSSSASSVPLFGSPSASSAPLFGSPSPFSGSLFGSGPSSSGTFFAANNGTLPSSSASPFTLHPAPSLSTSENASSTTCSFTLPGATPTTSASFFPFCSWASAATSASSFSTTLPSRTNFGVPRSSGLTSSTATTTPTPPLFTFPPPATSTASAAPGFNFNSAPALLLCERCGHKVAAYTPSHDEEPPGDIYSISAMPSYEDKSHEELRWSVYQSQGWNKGFHTPVSINASTTTAQPQVVVLPLVAFPVMPYYNFHGLGTSPWTPTWGVPAPSANITLFGQGNSSGTAVIPGVPSLCDMFRQL